MAIDWQSDLYGPIYAELGTAATLTPPAGSPVSLIVIDQTSGVEVEDRGVATIRPAAVVRMPSLTSASLTREDCLKATLVMSGKTWRVENTFPRPAPTGEASGELMLLLIETT